ncbi:hypothetical protein CR155_18410 [Pollutimonas nitritireducens]|uniref:DUF4390 domain-containing protein n=1 Tax=Pollutimonas nitritireducens TaxID=2045209 RepID=A0A2N4UBT9_9BURK|nr:DUF4390 domain-containing protein [Pollutimonas nitritireducens]PLC52472.1 hypothetical protein CR155_18410 [Pollutimonas nitritireducens]
MLRLLLSVFLCLSLVAVVDTSAQPQAERVARVEPIVREGKLYIDADIEFAVSGDLRNAAQKGVPIYFTADLEVVSKRWWWFDKAVISEQKTWRVVYNALTRQWRVGSGDLSLPESSLDDALSLLRNIRGWAVADIKDLETDELYEGKLRLRLNTSLLARPFQVDAFNSSAWSLATPWKNFTFSISLDEPRP